MLRLRKQHILGGNNYLLKTKDCAKWYQESSKQILIYNEEAIEILSFVVIFYVLAEITTIMTNVE
jgi:hypothetical protein